MKLCKTQERGTAGLQNVATVFYTYFHFSLSFIPRSFFSTTKQQLLNNSTLLIALFFLLLYQTEQMEAQWVQTAGLDSQTVYALGASNGNLYAGTDSGVFRSIDHGNHWFYSGLRDSRVTSITFSGADVVVGTSNGVYHSSDNGSTWLQIDTTFNQYIWSVITYGDFIFAAAGHVFRSRVDGNKWVRSDSGMHPYFEPQVLASSSTNLIAGGYVWPAEFGNDGLYRSTDSGQSWTRLMGGNVSAIVAAENKLFAGTNCYGVQFSSDTGSSWSYVGPDYHPCIGALAIYNNLTLAGASGILYGVYLTTDDGTTWSSFNTPPLQNSVINSILISDCQVLVGTVVEGIWRRPLTEFPIPHTVDLAVQENWNMVSVPILMYDYFGRSIFQNAVSQTYSYDNRYVARETLQIGKGYWVKFGSAQSVPFCGTTVTLDTFDVNQRWNMIGSISSPVSVTSVASEPPGMVVSQFFGYSPGAGYFAADTIQPGKGYWVKVNQSGKLILALSSSMLGLNRIKIAPASEMPPLPPDGTIETTLQTPTEFKLYENYPNPFNPATIIRYQLPVNSYVSLKVYNMLGQIVATLVDGMQDVGYKSVEFDASKLSTGIYFYSLITPEVSFTRKMVIIQ